MSDIFFDHVHIYTDEIDKTVEFYKRIFKATELRRIENQSTLIVHLDLRGVRLVISQCSEINTKGLGHFAVTVNDFEEALRGFRQAEMDITPTKHVKQYQNVFIKDPNGISIEVISPSTK